MADPKPSTSRVGRRHHLEVRDRHEVPDLDLAPARDRERRRLYPANADHLPRPATERHRRGSGKREVVDLVGLAARDRRVVEPGVVRIWPSTAEDRADGLGVLRGEHYPQDLAAVAAVLEDFLADELPLAVAVGGKPDPDGGP